MPTLSIFDGTKIIMYYRDHQPPHFHAIYAEYEAEIGIDPIMILEGNLPRPERTKVLAWAACINLNSVLIGNSRVAAGHCCPLSRWIERGL